MNITLPRAGIIMVVASILLGLGRRFVEKLIFFVPDQAFDPIYFTIMNALFFIGILALVVSVLQARKKRHEE